MFCGATGLDQAHNPAGNDAAPMRTIPMEQALTLRQRIAGWLDPTPVRIERDLFDLTVKCARRCAHDLEHAAGDVWYASRRPERGDEQSAMWHKRAEEWLAIFYPIGGMKDYHAKLHIRVDNAEELVDKLRAHCVANGISQWLDHEVPF